VRLLICAMVEVLYQDSSVCFCPPVGRVFRVMFYVICTMPVEALLI
jgi:hypothetical protein